VPGETKGSIRNTIRFARELDCETIQVSIAHAFPGTEFFDFVESRGFITNKKMEDGGGHQMAHVEYPGLTAEYVMQMVNTFYDEYYFRPRPPSASSGKPSSIATSHASTPKLVPLCNSVANAPGQQGSQSLEAQPSVGMKNKEDTKTRVQVPISKEVSGRNVQGYAC